MFEKVIYDQTLKVFHNVLSSDLFGFMKTHSCRTALLQMSEDWRNCIDNREAVGAVAVDLFTKLKAYGFSPHALEMMSSNLLGRQQCVSVAGVCPNFKSVKTGIPRGLLLEPLLFNISINDLHLIGAVRR